jgi:hypothetical protein
MVHEINGMKRNPSKYQAIVMGNSQVKPTFYCDGKVSPVKEELKLLGVTFDDKLKYDKQIAQVMRKVSQQVAVLKRMKKLLPFETRKDIYQLFIVPHFDYCSETWHFCIKTLTDKLEKVNERAIRFVFSRQENLVHRST